MNKRNLERILFVAVILFMCCFLFFNDYVKIPDVLVLVVAGLYLLILSILGLKRHKVYFTRAEPLTYKSSLIARLVNIIFGVFGVMIIILALIMKL